MIFNNSSENVQNCDFKTDFWGALNSNYVVLNPKLICFVVCNIINENNIPKMVLRKFDERTSTRYLEETAYLLGQL